MGITQRFLSTALCLAALTLFCDSTSAAAFKRVHQGETPPTFTLPDVGGKQVKLEDYRQGPLTILTFWALWSPKSVPLLQDIQKLMSEFEPKGLRALGVNSEGQNTPADIESQIKALAEKDGLKFPMLIDKGLEEYNKWGVIAAPSTALLGKDLVVVYEFSGHPTSAYQDMREQVLKTLGITEDVAKAEKPKRQRYNASKPVMLNYGLAKTLLQRGQFAKAEQKIAKVLEDDAKFPDAYAVKGAVYLGLAGEGKEKALETAQQSFEKAVELDKTVPLGLAGLAHFSLAAGDLPKSLEWARAAVENSEPGELASGEAAGDAKPGAPNPPQMAQLDQAEKALQAGNKDEAKSLIDQVIRSVLSLSEGPKMKSEGLIKKLEGKEK